MAHRETDRSCVGTTGSLIRRPARKTETARDTVAAPSDRSQPDSMRSQLAAGFADWILFAPSDYRFDPRARRLRLANPAIAHHKRGLARHFRQPIHPRSLHR